jgi:hypothetical protein
MARMESFHVERGALTCRDLIREKPCLVPTTLVWSEAAHPLAPAITKRAQARRATHTSASTFTYLIASSTLLAGDEIGMASVRPSTVALLACAAAFLVAAVGAQPMDPNQPANPILSDPNVIPIYMSPGEAPTFVSCYNNTDGQQGSEPTCNVLARQCPRGCPDTCYVHCPSCKLVCRKNRHTLRFRAFPAA